MWYAWRSARKVIQPVPWGDQWVPYAECASLCEKEYLCATEEEARQKMADYIEGLIMEHSNAIFNLQIQLEAFKS